MVRVGYPVHHLSRRPAFNVSLLGGDRMSIPFLADGGQPTPEPEHPTQRHQLTTHPLVSPRVTGITGADVDHVVQVPDPLRRVPHPGRNDELSAVAGDWGMLRLRPGKHPIGK